MRADPADYELVAPGNLRDVLLLLSREPGTWLPIAGGTDVMVLYASGKLPQRKLVSLWNLPELRRITATENDIRIGAACTYRDLLRNEIVEREFPLLVNAARWTGSIANQNRGTLGGNIVNASPAADSLPALLIYEAELLLVSVARERLVPYVDFHTGYKKMLLEPNELVGEIRLPRTSAEYFAYSRKVGARNAQAISKVCLSAIGRCENGVGHDIRMAVGSVAPVPLRLREAEATVNGKAMDPTVVAACRGAAMAEIRPIDDIRSTAAYRTAVVGNLVVEFLHSLKAHGVGKSKALARWNRLSTADAAQEIIACCGCAAWSQAVAARRPFPDERALMSASDEIWSGLSTQDWMEAFSMHPRIGDRKAPQLASSQSAAWSAQEQQKVAGASDTIQLALAEANREYERRFNRVFIVCATGKSAAEILDILQRRLRNDEVSELQEAAEEQRKITNIRLKKWLST